MFRTQTVRNRCRVSAALRPGVVQGVHVLRHGHPAHPAEPAVKADVVGVRVEGLPERHVRRPGQGLVAVLPAWRRSRSTPASSWAAQSHSPRCCITSRLRIWNAIRGPSSQIGALLTGQTRRSSDISSSSKSGSTRGSTRTVATFSCGSLLTSGTLTPRTDPRQPHPSRGRRTDRDPVPDAERPQSGLRWRHDRQRHPVGTPSRRHRGRADPRRAGPPARHLPLEGRPSRRGRAEHPRSARPR